MNKPKFSIGLTSTFVDNDAVNLVQGVVNDVVNGIIPRSEVSCIVSTRGTGDNPETDKRLVAMHHFVEDIRQRHGITIPLIEVSAREAGRVPKKDPTMEEKNNYDRKVLDAIRENCLRLPDVAVMLGDTIVHGSEWCESIPSLNLHPDLPLKMGGTEGIYWNVIGEWIRKGRNEAGGMMHLATPELDAGTAVAYFRVPLKGVVNGADLGSLWPLLPPDKDSLEKLIKEQTELKDKPNHPLFQELRQAEAQLETPLIRLTLIALAQGKVAIKEGKVLDEAGKPIVGLDLTKEVVGSLAIWPGGEGNPRCHRKESQI